MDFNKQFNTNFALFASNKINNDENSFKVSVIVTTYNVNNYLITCLDSIINNTYKNLEILLIDDGSTDNTLLICEKYASMDSRIKIITQKNSGISSARNNGLSHASGDAVHFVDGDDYVTKDFYTLMVAVMKRDASCMVCCTYYNEKRALIDAPLTLTHYGLIGKLSTIEGWLKGVCCMLFCINFLRKNNELRFDTDFTCGEDTIFLVKAVYFAEKISAMPDAVYYHRFNLNSVTNATKTEREKEVWRKQAFLVGDVLDEFAKEKGISQEIWQNHKNKNGKLAMKYYKDVIDEIHSNPQSLNNIIIKDPKEEIINTPQSKVSLKKIIKKFLIKSICIIIPKR